MFFQAENEDKALSGAIQTFGNSYKKEKDGLFYKSADGLYRNKNGKITLWLQEIQKSEMENLTRMKNLEYLLPELESFDYFFWLMEMEKHKYIYVNKKRFYFGKIQSLIFEALEKIKALKQKIKNPKGGESNGKIA